MTTSLLKTGVQPTPETSCIVNIPHTTENIQHSVPMGITHRHKLLENKEYVM